MQTATLSAVEDSRRRTEQLGDKMYALYCDHGEATETMLLREGFSLYELKTLGTAAQQIAEQRRIRRGGWPGPERTKEGFTKTDEEWTDIAASQADGLVDHTLIFAQLRAFGIPTIVIGRIWPRLMRKLASSLAGRPMPVGA